ncbi:MAG: flagellar biosynthesis anti-sigma factor FlgM [Ruminococcus sp.]|jgi:anti-sigma28 factor (negative regulator of flagellin synthesis)|nr:flagellar biosynthesis anti-sigma factor FlgM [Ruminococcus sp.]
MNINNVGKLINAYGISKTNKQYKTGHPENNQIKLVPVSGDTTKKDVIQISGEAAAGRAISSEAKRIAGEIARTDNSDKVEELRQAYQNGTYNVSNEDVADSIISRLFG